MTTVPKLCTHCKLRVQELNRSWCGVCNTESVRRWLQADPVRAAANKAIRNNNSRCRRQGAVGSVGTYEWMAVLEQHGYACACCRTVTKLTIDHVKPLSRGGTNTIDNVQPLCRRCNMLKGTEEIDFRKQE